MGQKVHPVGYRIGVIYDWESRWYADGKKYAKFLHNDLELREWIRKRWNKAGVSRVEIERIGNVMRFTVWTARPGVVIGKQGAEIQAVREELQAKTGSRVMINIQEIKNPDAEAQVVAEGVAASLERRISFRRAAISSSCARRSRGRRRFGSRPSPDTSTTIRVNCPSLRPRWASSYPRRPAGTVFTFWNRWTRNTPSAGSS